MKAHGMPRTVVADPPWWPRLHANTVGRMKGPYRAGPQRYYRLLSVEQIIALAPTTAPKAHLYLWVINQHLDWGYQVARAWDFGPVLHLDELHDSPTHREQIRESPADPRTINDCPPE